MAKSKIKSTITDWQHLEESLKELTGLEADLKLEELAMDEEIKLIQEKYQKANKEKTERRNFLLFDVEIFCEENKKDFSGKSRSKKTIWGTMGFRESSKGAIILLKKIKDGYKLAAKALDDLVPGRYTRMVPELEKDIIAADVRAGKLSDTMLAAANLRYVKDDLFYYKPDFKKIEEQRGVKIPVKKIREAAQ